MRVRPRKLRSVAQLKHGAQIGRNIESAGDELKTRGEELNTGEGGDFNNHNLARQMKPTLGLGSGLVGAASVTLLNYAARRYLPQAPRLDILGLQLARAAFSKARIEPPRGFALKVIALIGALVSNSLFYGLVGLGKTRTAWLRGGALGLAMGIGAVSLPEALSASNDTTARTPIMKARTIAWYVVGGLLAALTFAASRTKHPQKASISAAN